MTLSENNTLFCDSFNNALKNVFRKLLKRKNPIADDTCLQKLLDIVPNFVSDVENVEFCGAAEFLKSLTTDPSIGNATLVFGTQMAGCLTQNEDIFVHFEKLFTDFYSSVFKSAFWSECLSLKTSVFQSLQKTIQHLSGFLCITNNFTDISMEALNAVYEETSIFLTKEACKFLASIIIQSSRVDKEHGQFHNVSELRNNLLDKLWNSVCHGNAKTSDSKHNTFQESIFFILYDAGNGCNDVWPWMASQQSVLIELNQIIISSKSSELWNTAFDLYLNLLLTNHDNEEWVGENILDTIKKLYGTKQLNKMQTLIVKSLKRFPVDDISEKLMEHLHQPLSDVVSSVINKSSLEGEQTLPTTGDYDCPLQCEIFICYTIDCWETLLDPELLKRDSIKTMVRSATCCLLQVFGIVTATEIHQISRHHAFFKVISSSTKLLVRILHYFQQLADCSHQCCLLDPVSQLTLLSIVVSSVERMGQSSLVVSHSFDCILLYIPSLLDHGNIVNASKSPRCASTSDVQNSNVGACDPSSADLPNRVSNAVVLCLCHPQWEIRDSAVEFLSKIFASCNTSKDLLLWVQRNKLHSLVYSSLSDGESYVRAATISALVQCLAVDALWADFLLTTNKTQEDIMEDITHVLQTDTEAFPRRVAAKFLLKIYKKLHNRVQLYKVMYDSLHNDLDWEVKMAGVEFWNNVAFDEFSNLQKPASLPSYAVGLVGLEDKCEACSNCVLLKALYKLSCMGCTESLLSAYRDCDYGVQEKAGKVLARMNTFVTNWIQTDDLGQCLAKKEHEMEQDLYGCCSKSCCNDCEHTSKHHKGFAFLQTLLNLDVTNYLSECGVHCDLYTKNPLFLIEDILADCEEGEDNTIDCY